MSIKVVFELGHNASLKSKQTPNGFTHDWELFVRGNDGSSKISHFVDKVVFNLHESFPKPKRGKLTISEQNKQCEYRNSLKSIRPSISHRVVQKEPPYTLKESGYAGFLLPIDIYFKGQGREDPKKVTFQYDLSLQNTGLTTNVEKRTHTFNNPSPEFRRKLIEGGGIVSVGQMDEKSRDAVDERTQLISKPKLGGSDGKKHKSRPTADEPKPSSTFANLFGPPITPSTSKVSPDARTATSGGSNSNRTSQKSVEKVSSKDKSEKSSKEKKDKSKHSSPAKDGSLKESSSKKNAGSDEKRGRDEKRKEKTHTKERDRSKDKSQKRPITPKPTSRSPKRSSPPRNSNNRYVADNPLPQKNVNEEKSSSNSSTKKSKKEKKDKSHDKDKDRDRSGDKKEKELKHQSKDRDDRSGNKTSEKVDALSKRDRESGGNNTPKESTKDKTATKSSGDAKSSSNDAAFDTMALEQKNATASDAKKADKYDKDASDRKHKHKKKDKNKDKDKDRSGSKDRKKDKDKSAKQKDTGGENSVAPSGGHKRGGPVSQVENSGPPAPAPKIKPINAMLSEINDTDSSDSDHDGISASPAANTSKNSSTEKPDVLDAIAPIHSNATLPDVVTTKHSTPIPSQASVHSPSTKPDYSGAKGNDKSNKRAAKEAKAADKEDKKRKRKVKDEVPPVAEANRRTTPSPNVSTDGPPHKVPKKEEPSRVHHENNGTSISPLQQLAHVPSTSPQSAAGNHQSHPNEHFTASTLSNSCHAVTPLSGDPYRSPTDSIPVDYMSELKALQHKIMALQDNSELQQVVEMIAATGCYEITSKTFDFDLCALDRSTVQRLQDFFSQSQSVAL